MISDRRRVDIVYSFSYHELTSYTRYRKAWAAHMAMKASAIRFAPDEREWITAFAEMNGTTFSAQVRQWTLERLEDEMDARDLKAAIDEDDGSRISWSDAKSELGLA